ncbi:MAG: 2-C-methyl-D-erythritol 4-phosphate cytidylyltransferase [Thioalkalivibrionaceae bacterium]
MKRGAKTRIWAVVVAAGRGLRMGGPVPKQYRALDPARPDCDDDHQNANHDRQSCSDEDGSSDTPFSTPWALLLEQALAPLLASARVHGVVLVAPAQDVAALVDRLNSRWLRASWLLSHFQTDAGRAPPWQASTCDSIALTSMQTAEAVGDITVSGRESDVRRLWVVAGGSERIDSVLAGLEALPAEVDPSDQVLIHDGARPCLDEDDLAALVDWAAPRNLHDEAAANVGVILAAESVDSLKEVDETGRIVAAPDRSHIWRALTPQKFPLQALRARMRIAVQADVEQRARFTDEASVWCAYGGETYVLAGQVDNVKVTRPDDERRALSWLRSRHPERTASRGIGV